MPNATVDNKLDLVLRREVKLPRRLIWKAWTEPEHMKPWFCPKPWQATEIEIDLRPGGIFRSVMRGPNGETMDNPGCILEVVPQQRLVWTTALQAGFRPVDKPFLSFTAILSFDEIPGGTRYSVVALHGNDATRKQHAEMGFEPGWGKALDQLIEYMSALK